MLARKKFYLGMYVEEFQQLTVVLIKFGIGKFRLR